MGILSNPRYEAFAQARAAGSTAEAAMAKAGYKARRGNATRLNTNKDIVARVAELQAAKVRKVVEHLSFEARDMFADLKQTIAMAQADGAYQAAMKGHEMMLQSFGFLDSPTLTHEHVRGQRVKIDETPAPEGAESNVVQFDPGERRFAHLVAKMRRKME